MNRLTLLFFGQCQAIIDGEPITGFRTQKVQALLACLAAEPYTAHRRERLMTMLWPGMPEPSARANLRQILFHLRQAIPDFDYDGTPVPLLIANRQTIQLNPEANITVDTTQFETLFSQAQRHQHVDLLTCDTCYQTLQTAVSIYRGHFLADFYLDDSNDFEEWAEITRQQFRRKMLDVLDILTTIATRRAAYAEARAYAEQQLAIDDLHEAAYRQLMEILALSGQRVAALSLYESCRRLLAEEMGMAPTAQTTALYEKIQAGELHFDQHPAPDIRGYELKEEIGAGAYGVIHRAVQPAIGREVAIKIIRHRYANDPAFIRRFECEAQTIARLEHPHIVPLYDYWRESGGAYLVMRLLRGGSLLTKLQSGSWSVEKTYLFLNQIAPALFTAHQQGIIHRDIKPANILFDETGNAYLSDFGIAKDLNQERQLTADGDIVGTLDYISPEQLQAGEVTPQSDIYSLGAVLYEVLAGEKPFPNLPLGKLIQSHLLTPFPLVSQSQPGLSLLIDDVIQQATAKKPEDRFPTVLGLAEAFGLAMNGRSATLAFPAPLLVDTDIPNPYKGLRAYQEADTLDFFGRERLTSQLVDQLAQSRFLAVVGPSGSGKSSLVKAGLIPALRQGALPNSDKWYIAQMVPGDQPLEELELALWPIAVNPPPSLLEPMQKDSRGMLRTIRRILPDEEDAQLLLVIDQFEELFTMADDTQRTHFLESLYVALTAPRTPLHVILTLRADFYDRPLQYQPLADLFKEHTALVLPLSRDELTWAVQEPARRAGVTFEEGLLPAIVADVDAQPGSLPLLQYALTEMFAARHRQQMTRQAYATIGGVPGALARRADEIFYALSAAQQALARQLFLRLVTVGEGAGDTVVSPDTRRRVRLSEVQQLGDTDEITTVINQFGDARLLTFDRDPATREPTVEVAHEALLHRWERLRSWLMESRADIRLQRQLAIAAADWAASDQDEGYLLRGARLTQYEAWQQQSTLHLLPLEVTFLQASLSDRMARQTAETARQQRELETARQLVAAESQRASEQTEAARRLRRRAIWLTGALAIAAVLAGAALLFAQRAQASATEARSIAMAASAETAMRDDNVDLALALVLAANDLASPPAFARRVLYDVGLAPGAVRQIIGGGGWRWSLDVTPDGRFAASGADDGSVTIWDLDTGEEQLRLAGEYHEAVGDVVFTPNGRSLLTSSYDDQIILYDAVTGAVIWRALNPSGDPNSLSVSPDGKLAAVGTEGGVITLWNLETGALVGELAGHNPDWQVLPVAFSPNGRLLASGSETGEVIIWDVDKQALLKRIQVIDDVLFTLAFSPDGQTLAVAGKSNTIWFYDVNSGEPVGELSGLPDWVFNVAYSPDGSHLLAASRDGAVMVWDVVSQRLVQAFYGEDGFALNAAFVNEKEVVASYNTGNVRVWDLADGRLQRSFAGDAVMPSAAQDINGRLLAVGLNNVIQLLDLQTGKIVRELQVEAGSEMLLDSGDVTALALDPAGELLLSGFADGRIFLWDVASGEKLQEFSGHTAFIHQLAFSPDGQLFLSVSDDARLILWDIGQEEPRFAYTNPTDAITSVAFRPDGQQFAAGMGTTRYVADFDATKERDTRILLWETDNGKEVTQLTGHTGPVTAVAFSPDGRFLLSGSLDATLRLWDVDNGRLVRRFDGHTGGVMSAVWSADGAYAASGGQDGTLIVWNSASGELLRQIAAHDGVIHHVAFTENGDGVWSAAEDGKIHLWATSLDDTALKAWIIAHRHIQPLTCLQKAQYGLNDLCADDS